MMAVSELSQRISIHFFGAQNDRPLTALAGALGAGPLARGLGVEAQRYDRLIKTAPLFFELASRDAARLWLYAHELQSQSELDGQLSGLPPHVRHCVFLDGRDDTEPLQVTHPGVTIFRTSLLTHARLPHERAMPAPCDDVLATVGGKLVERPWSKRPLVGFCGFVGSRLKRLAFHALQQHQKSVALDLRERSLCAFEESSAIQTLFIRRSAFWGGSMSRFHFNEAHQRKVRDEFIRNLLDTDYTLCVRGKGNFSFRLYETLSAGRIPIFVNSDCVLPFEDRIDWKSHAVWLDQTEIETAVDKLLDFHEKLGPRGFGDLQRANRSLWEDWLSPEGFFPKAFGLLTSESKTC
jgi:hypothetical protein